ncbi:molecular chaperone [Rhodoferax sp.]|uniref:fimbrial biogenesis chaperone n=1 Tax=Rhodoferax sp. TaxID=50421 RepID=UPI0025DF24A8|nr:molecular chaperone [Rhodoferax sp.]
MIWPVDPIIEDGQQATALWLENRASDNVSLQIRVFGWSQSGTAENFENQDELIASPPLAVIPAGQRQLIRLMHTAPVPAGKELAYRVLVDELPETDVSNGPPPDGSLGGGAMGVKLQIRYSIPLFVNGKGVWTKPRADKPRDPATAAQPALTWRAVREGNAQYLVVRNSGPAHARIVAVQWVGPGPPVVINPGLLGYVLANSEMRWLLSAPPPPGYAPEAKVNGGEAPMQLPSR